MIPILTRFETGVFQTENPYRAHWRILVFPWGWFDNSCATVEVAFQPNVRQLHLRLTRETARQVEGNLTDL
jgi:hypothetical protein